MYKNRVFGFGIIVVTVLLWGWGRAFSGTI
jgi:hypothetical protein